MPSTAHSVSIKAFLGLARHKEQTNLAGERDRIRPLATILEEHLEKAAWGSDNFVGDATPELDDAEREKIEKELRDLGYL